MMCNICGFVTINTSSPQNPKKGPSLCKNKCVHDEKQRKSKFFYTVEHDV